MVSSGGLDGGDAILTQVVLGYAQYFLECSRYRCSSECAPYLPAVAWCGNGKLEMGEACDDGNQVDTDACSNSCVKKP